VTTSQHLVPASPLVALYCTVDDLYQEHFAARKPVRPGRRPEVSDSEILTLVLLAQWRQDRSERAFVAYARTHLRAYFPRLLSQSAFNRRARDLMGVLCALGPAIRQRAISDLGLPSATHEVVDAVPVPLMRRCRGSQHRLFRDEAAIGRGGSDRDWYYGVKLLTAVDNHGFVTGFVAGPANTEERWLAEAFYRWRLAPDLPPPAACDLIQVLGPTHRAGGQRKGPTGPLGPRAGVGVPACDLAIADLNYDGEAWNRHWCHHYGGVVLTEALYRDLDQDLRREAKRWLHGLRQTVESVFGKLDGTLGLKFPRARSLWGLHTRLAAKMAAHNFSLYVNSLSGMRPFAACRPLD
jgi:hypothetical protein